MPSTILSTTLDLYKGSVIAPANQVSGYPKTFSNDSSTEQSAKSINIGISPDNTTLYPGTIYGVRAYCTAEADSDWYPSSGLVQFTTQISINWDVPASPPAQAKDCVFTENSLNHEFELHIPAFQIHSSGQSSSSAAGISYNSTDTAPTAVWIYVGNQSQVIHAIKMSFTATEASQGITITNNMMTSAGCNWDPNGKHFHESSTYRVWIGVTDAVNGGDGTTANDSRLYINSTEAVVGTPIATPVVQIGSPTATYNSVTINGIQASSTGEQILSGYAMISTSSDFSSGNTYRVNLSNPIPSNVTITDGDTDYQGNTISISPTTTYYVKVVVATTTYPATSSNIGTVTTPAAVTGTVVISSVTNVTPSSATVNLTYNP